MPQLPLEEGRATNDFLLSTHVGTWARILLQRGLHPHRRRAAEACLVRV